jgi:hypothetical protein
VVGKKVGTITVTVRRSSVKIKVAVSTTKFSVGEKSVFVSDAVEGTTPVANFGAYDVRVKLFVPVVVFSESATANLLAVSEAFPGTTRTLAVAMTVAANVVNERLRFAGIRASASFGPNVADVRLFVLGVSFSASTGAKRLVENDRTPGVGVFESAVAPP